MDKDASISPPLRGAPKAARTAGRSRSAATAEAALPPRARALVRQLTAEVDRLSVALAAARQEAAVLAAHAAEDALTGLANRRGFLHDLERTLSYVRRYDATATLLYLDLDGFKSINDQRGHATGDTVLRAVADLLRRQVRASDTVARLGGDEFALILWNIAAEDAARKVESLRAAITGLPAGEGRLGASIGLAPITGETTPAALLAQADAAMYAQKRARGGR